MEHIDILHAAEKANALKLSGPDWRNVCLATKVTRNESSNWLLRHYLLILSRYLCQPGPSIWK